MTLLKRRFAIGALAVLFLAAAYVFVFSARGQDRVPRRHRDQRGLHGHHGRQGRLDRRLDHDHAHLRLRDVRLDVGPRPGRRPQAGQRAEDLAHQPVHDLERGNEVGRRPDQGRHRLLHPRGPPYLRLPSRDVRLHEREPGRDLRVHARHRPQARQQHPGGEDRPDHALAPGHGAVPDGPRVHRDHGQARRDLRLRIQRRRGVLRRFRSERSLGLRDHAGRPAVDARDGQARRGLVRPAPPRRPRLRLPERVAHRRDRPEQQGLLHGLAERHLLRGREQALRPGLREAVQLETRLFAARRERLELAGPDGPVVALLQHRRPVAQDRPRDAGHGLSLFGQARQAALRRRRHVHHPRQVLRHAVRSGQGHPRRAVSEPQLLRRDAQDQRQQRRVHEPRPVPERAAERHRRHHLAVLRPAGHGRLHAPLRRHHGHARSRSWSETTSS